MVAKDPVSSAPCMAPQAPDSAWGRAPFMAGTKRLGPHEFGTFGFDVAVLWLMNTLLAAALVAHRPGRVAAPRRA